GPGDHTLERLLEAETLMAAGDHRNALNAVGQAVAPHDSALAVQIVTASHEIAGSPPSPALAQYVESMLVGAIAVSEAARTGDQTALKEALAAMHAASQARHDDSGGEQSQGSPTTAVASDMAETSAANPSVTAPGQNKDPAEGNGNLGQGDANPSVTAPGQVEGEGNHGSNGNGGNGNGKP
ncbi:MAG: hypothetical protein LC739_04470, partial [Actinobacteria bacterium]|nr:hypothetical protein [Actinomycetota bacterium]